ncbi:MAG TPA: hypothetical protein GX735_00930 [Firmicutes bacterium]|jgi:DNA/RNA-binding domain of Phe-tRNA-synthetase-like protein|nr:hypothetical protein [Bacillota bacterium]
MRFRVAPEIFAQFPEVCIGVVVARGVDNQGESSRIKELLATQVEAAHRKLAGGDVRQHPLIIPWREAFRQLGYNPNRFPPSIEALAKRVTKSPSLPSINRVVDLVNALSLKYMLPMGAHDLDRLRGDMQVRLTVGGEVFTPFGSEEAETVEAGEVVYTDDQEVRTRRWVWRQGEKAKVVPGSRTIFFPIDGFRGISDGEILAARDELAALLTRHLGAETRCLWVDGDTPAVDLL